MNITLQPRVAKRIQIIRGAKVILDADLAELYGVSTKALNLQARTPPRALARADFEQAACGQRGRRAGAAPDAVRARRRATKRQGLSDVEAAFGSGGEAAADKCLTGQANTPPKNSPVCHPERASPSRWERKQAV